MVSLSLNCVSDDSLQENMSVVSIAAALHVNVSLTQLRFDNDFISQVGVAAIARMLQVNMTLLKFEIFSSSLDDADAVMIANALRMNQSLRQLILHGSRLGDAGAIALAELLKVNSTLQVLYYGFALGDAACVSLATALCGNTSLCELVLGNSHMTDIGAVALADMLRVNNTLQLLECSEETAVSERGEVELCDAFSRKQQSDFEQRHTIRQAFKYYGPGHPRKDYSDFILR
jgi:hypothetical protein